MNNFKSKSDQIAACFDRYASACCQISPLTRQMFLWEIVFDKTTIKTRTYHHVQMLELLRSLSSITAIFTLTLCHWHSICHATCHYNSIAVTVTTHLSPCWMYSCLGDCGKARPVSRCSTAWTIYNQRKATVENDHFLPINDSTAISGRMVHPRSVPKREGRQSGVTRQTASEAPELTSIVPIPSRGYGRF